MSPLRKSAIESRIFCLEKHERVDAARPLVANSLFGENEVEDEGETLEVTDELETEEESEEETV